MKLRIIYVFSFFVLVSILSKALAQSHKNDYEERKNLFNYQMLCQGCHVGDGRGGKSVPDMRNHLGYFLTFSEGREYLIRVPGTANAALNSQELASLINWMVYRFGGDSIPENFRHYTESEVENLRKKPLKEVTKYRLSLLEQIKYK